MSMRSSDSRPVLGGFVLLSASIFGCYPTDNVIGLELGRTTSSAGAPATSSSGGVPVGAGTFGARVDYVTGNSPRSVEVGDVNADGKLDAVTANGADGTVSILLGSGDGRL